MKIKEVISKTELTDKAIRLYIDNGLVAPSIDESYSGRKSIDFSDDDVERLSNIALLRKAGFSISDIKEIIESDEKAQAVVKRFIEETENNIQHETDIVEKLRNIPAENGFSMETICESLSKTVEEKQVPIEDLRLSFKEKCKRNFAVTFAAGGIALSVVSLIIVVVFWKTNFIHTNLSDGTFECSLICYGGILLIFILSSILLIINWNNVFIGKKKKITDWFSGALSLAIVTLATLSFFSSVLGSLFLSTFICSQTTDIKDYLVFDKFIEDEYGIEIKKIFPKEIPESATKTPDRIFEESYPLTTKYYYRHSYVLDPDFDIVAEWVLPQDEYEKAKKELSGKELYTITKNDWNIMVFVDGYEPGRYSLEQYFWRDNWDNDGYWYLMFAYNDKTNKVRYIAAYAIDSYEYGPYYLSLDW